MAGTYNVTGVVNSTAQTEILGHVDAIKTIADGLALKMHRRMGMNKYIRDQWKLLNAELDALKTGVDAAPEA